MANGNSFRFAQGSVKKKDRGNPNARLYARLMELEFRTENATVRSRNLLGDWPIRRLVDGEVTLVVVAFYVRIDRKVRSC